MFPIYTSITPLRRRFVNKAMVSFGLIQSLSVKILTLPVLHCESDVGAALFIDESGLKSALSLRRQRFADQSHD